METIKKDFEIGLVLAGAVSAGAYTAGVMDFLLEALEAWDKAKAENKNVPMHNVKIKVITGASAGGMTAAMAAVEIRKRATGQGAVGKSSSFYKAWVEMIDIKALLSCDDLADKKGKKSKKPIVSFLNASIIDKIADEIIKIEDGEWTQPRYAANELKVYLSLSNLRGIPYRFDLAGETGFPYEMTSHADYQYIEVGKDTKEKEWEKLKSAAIATGAFPLGLSARIIERSKKEYEKRLKEDGLATSKLMEVGDDENFDFVAVDGGLLNNEPMELAKAALYAHEPDALEQENKNREILKKLSEQNNEANANQSIIQQQIDELKKKKGETLSNAIIMVDPFPNINRITKKPELNDLGLLNIIGPVLGAMRSQCLFKPEELLLSTSDDVYDRFLVAPIRHSKGDENVVEKNPLASGFFEGFGGFLSYDFRKHDYHLGRRNCQQFLKSYFSVPVEDIQNNEIFKGKILTEYITSQQKYPIIPLVGNLSQEEEPTMPWPTYSLGEFNTFKKLLAIRIIGLLNKALPIARLSNVLWLIILAIFVSMSSIHYHQYTACGRWTMPCDTTAYYLKSFGFGTLEFGLMLVTSVLLIFQGVLHMIKVWVKIKVVGLIESYLREYKLDIK